MMKKLLLQAVGAAAGTGVVGLIVGYLVYGKTRGSRLQLGNRTRRTYRRQPIGPRSDWTAATWSRPPGNGQKSSSPGFWSFDRISRS